MSLYGGNGNVMGMPGMGTGFQFNGMQPKAVPQLHNNLSQEEIQRLIQKENGFTLNITEVEALRAKCNHRWNNGGSDAIVDGPDGTCHCQICGYTFEPISNTESKESLQERCKGVTDALQTIKMLYFDMPENIASEYFKIIPLIDKIPELFEHAAQNYMKYDSAGAYGYNNHNMSTMQAFNQLVGLLHQPMAQPMNNPGMMPQQPMMGQPGMMNPGMMPQQPMMGQPMNPQYTNGFVGQPQPYAPQTVSYQFQPGAQPAPETTTVEQTVTNATPAAPAQATEEAAKANFQA